jgi:heme A synthase
MSTLTEPGTGSALATRLERVRMASFGALTMLVLQFVIGTAYNLYGTAPTAKKSVGLFSSPLLAIHVILGILLVIAAAMLVFRAVQAKSGAVLATSIAGLVAILAAGGAGSSFAQDGADGASLGMAIATAVAMLCYAANLVIIPHGKQQG